MNTEELVRPPKEVVAWVMGNIYGKVYGKPGKPFTYKYASSTQMANLIRRPFSSRRQDNALSTVNYINHLKRVSGSNDTALMCRWALMMLQNDTAVSWEEFSTLLAMEEMQ